MMTTISGAITPLGLAVSAPVVDHLGVQTLWLIGGVVCLAQEVGGFFIPAVMRIEDGPGKRWEQVEGAAAD